jgi:hypothetical protein
MNGLRQQGIYSFTCRYGYLFVSGAIILVSFFNLSERFYPLLNSDIAVNILMAADFHLPGDLYFWGQDRAGSMIPLLASPLIRITGISPVIAVSLIHYFILVLGFSALASLMKGKMPVILLCMVWFLPPWHFQDFVVLLFGIQASFVAIGLYFLRKLFGGGIVTLQPVWTGAFILSIICGIWVSDLVWVSGLALILLGSFMVIEGRKDKEFISVIKSRITFRNIITFLAFLLAGILFLIYAKSTAVKIPDYNRHIVNSFHEMTVTVAIVAGSVLKVFLFSSENAVESLFAWIALAGVPIFLVLFIRSCRRLPSFRSNPLFWFFLFEGLMLFGSMVMSHWVFINGAGRRYFSLCFFSFSVSLLFLADGVDFRGKRLSMLILFMAFVVSAGSAISGFWYPVRRPATVDVLSGFTHLGQAGVIAEYWNAYRTSGASPLNIVATPREEDQVRNPALVGKLFDQPSLYIIRDSWFDAFPETLTQFGRVLQREGKEFYLGDCWVCRYKVVDK